MTSSFRQSLDDLVRQAVDPSVVHDLSERQQQKHRETQKLLHAIQGAPIDVSSIDWALVETQAALRMLVLSANQGLIEQCPLDWTQAFPVTSKHSAFRPPQITQGFMLSMEPNIVADVLLSPSRLKEEFQYQSDLRRINQLENFKDLQSRALGALLGAQKLSADTPLPTTGLQSTSSSTACVGNIALASLSPHVDQILATRSGPIIGSPFEMAHAVCIAIITHAANQMFLQDDQKRVSLSDTTVQQLCAQTLDVLAGHDIDVMADIPRAPLACEDQESLCLGSLMFHAISKGMSHHINEQRSKRRNLEKTDPQEGAIIHVDIPAHVQKLSNLLLRLVENIPLHQRQDALSVFVDEGLMQKSHQARTSYANLALKIVLANAEPQTCIQMWQVVLHRAKASGRLEDLLMFPGHNIVKVGSVDDIKTLVEMFATLFQTSTVSQVHESMPQRIRMKLEKCFDASLHPQLNLVLDEFEKDFKEFHTYLPKERREKITLNWVAKVASSDNTAQRAARKM